MGADRAPIFYVSAGPTFHDFTVQGGYTESTRSAGYEDDDYSGDSQYGTTVSVPQDTVIVGGYRNSSETTTYSIRETVTFDTGGGPESSVNQQSGRTVRYTSFSPSGTAFDATLFESTEWVDVFEETFSSTEETTFTGEFGFIVGAAGNSDLTLTQLDNMVGAIFQAGTTMVGCGTRSTTMDASDGTSYSAVEVTVTVPIYALSYPEARDQSFGEPGQAQITQDIYEAIRVGWAPIGLDVAALFPGANGTHIMLGAEGWDIAGADYTFTKPPLTTSARAAVDGTNASTASTTSVANAGQAGSTFALEAIQMLTEEVTLESLVPETTSTDELTTTASETTTLAYTYNNSGSTKTRQWTNYFTETVEGSRTWTTGWATDTYTERRTTGYEVTSLSTGEGLQSTVNFTTSDYGGSPSHESYTTTVGRKAATTYAGYDHLGETVGLDTTYASAVTITAWDAVAMEVLGNQTFTESGTIGAGTSTARGVTIQDTYDETVAYEEDGTFNEFTIYEGELQAIANVTMGYDGIVEFDTSESWDSTDYATEAYQTFLIEHPEGYLQAATWEYDMPSPHPIGHGQSSFNWPNRQDIDVYPRWADTAYEADAQWTSDMNDTEQIWLGTSTALTTKSAAGTTTTAETIITLAHTVKLTHSQTKSHELGTINAQPQDTGALRLTRGGYRQADPQPIGGAFPGGGGFTLVFKGGGYWEIFERGLSTTEIDFDSIVNEQGEADVRAYSEGVMAVINQWRCVEFSTNIGGGEDYTTWREDDMFFDDGVTFTEQ